MLARYIILGYLNVFVLYMVFANTVIAQMDHRKHRNMQSCRANEINSRLLFYDVAKGINCDVKQLQIRIL